MWYDHVIALLYINLVQSFPSDNNNIKIFNIQLQLSQAERILSKSEI